MTLIDSDLVSASKCVQQPFCQAEIGLRKATVLVSRIDFVLRPSMESDPGECLQFPTASEK